MCLPRRRSFSLGGAGGSLQLKLSSAKVREPKKRETAAVTKTKERIFGVDGAATSGLHTIWWYLEGTPRLNKYS